MAQRYEIRETGAVEGFHIVQREFGQNGFPVIPIDDGIGTIGHRKSEMLGGISCVRQYHAFSTDECQCVQRGIVCQIHGFVRLVGNIDGQGVNSCNITPCLSCSVNK